MKLWEYLKNYMSRYKDRIAFANSGITYAGILSYEKMEKSPELVLCEGVTRELQAIRILKCIATGGAAVPVTREYGNKSYEYVQGVVNGTTKQDIDDLAFLMFTSGTTGTPKGVMLTHANIISNLEYISSYFDIKNMQKICIARPLVHIAVLTGELLYALCNGLTIYFYEEAFMPQRLLSYCAENQIDVFCATPTLYQMLAIANRDKTHTLKVGVISGEPLSLKVGKFIAESFPKTNFYNVYGLTEHSPRVSALLPVDFYVKPNSVGKVIGDVKIKFLDGELLVKSASVMKGYYLDETSTKKKILDGWLHTGDTAHLDADGYLYIDGRKDNMLIRAGINVYPEEIENIVKECENIEDCLVFGKTTESGILICLKYVGNIKPAELRKYLIKRLNPNIIPNKIEKVERLERTVSGKKLRI